jgi:hypothetical protein
MNNGGFWKTIRTTLSLLEPAGLVHDMLLEFGVKSAAALRQMGAKEGAMSIIDDND